ncbi:MAG: D-alanyl-D-alanine endopeptidase [Acinetobacter sp.]|nr:MAG: D-alanyl-D-alanine endopeptidase [Acinetobacter sp.]
MTARMGLLLASVLACNTSFAEIIMQQTAPSASIAWSDTQAGQFLSNDQSEVKQRSNNTTVLNNSTLANKYPTTSNHYSTSASQPSVNARAAIVMDAQTGEVLFGKNQNMTLPIASITKLMTAVVTADARLDMSQRIRLESIDFAGAGGKNSSSTLRVGDEMNRAELLLAALMKSENPAAAALARTYPGGRSAFIAAMNNKARQLGMTSANYAESTGLDPHNVASARDLALLVRAASQYGLIRQFSTTPNYDFNLGYRVLKSNNTNALVRNGGWNIHLSKTGYINEAGRCVVMEATVNQRPAVIVLLGASTTAARNNDATNLMSWLGRGVRTL